MINIMWNLNPLILADLVRVVNYKSKINFLSGQIDNDDVHLDTKRHTVKPVVRGHPLLGSHLY